VQIIEFLGRLAAMQLYLDPPYVARVPILDENNLKWVVPFRVVQGGDLEGPSAVSVRVGGERYSVPQPDPMSPNRDQSVRVMAFVIELQNRARQEAPIQGPGISILQWGSSVSGLAVYSVLLNYWLLREGELLSSLVPCFRVPPGLLTRKPLRCMTGFLH
jgi:hypothetical protein